jgi:methyl-accepting chemotaxis protein
MNWFKNLNATPRLLLSFGVLIVLIAVISFLAIGSLSQANDRMEVLYHDDMLGALQTAEISIARMSLGRQVRDAALDIDDPAVVAADKRTMLADFVKIHSNLELAEKTFYTKEGKVLTATIRNTLPDYEKAYHDLYEQIEGKDLAGAKTAIVAVTAVGQPLFDAAERARALKAKEGEEKFDANNLSYHSARSLILAAAAISLTLGVILGIFIARSFAMPLGEAVAALELVAGGDLTVSLAVHTNDEVGQMASALNTALEKVRTTLREVAESAANSNVSSRELAAAAEQIATGAQQQAESLEQTSASLELITATVRQSADNARQASQLATGSRESAEQGQEVVSSAIAAMAEINTASAKISDIISTINEIAFQTNLLAVNAAVEAARAGEEGRGFAVVATEVRSLAQRSAEAAKEIKGLIQDSLEKVDKGSELVNRSGATLQGIVASVKRVTDIVGEIAAASSEQSVGIDQVNSAITQMDQVTQSNSAQTEELSSTAQNLSGQAGHLLKLVSTFTLGNSRPSTNGSGHQPSPRNVLHSRATGHRPDGVTSRGRSGMSGPSAPNRRKQPSPSVVLVGRSAAKTREDASFQEF